MAAIKVGETFGLDAAAVDKADWSLALRRVIHDLRSDFIYAPHLGLIYRKAGEALISQIKSDLKSGKFSPGVPLTIEVPKSFRIRVVGSKRHGPNSSRPGSILLPWDRILYQALADAAAPIIEGQLSKERSFSHRLSGPNEAAMFVPTRSSWNELQKALRTYSKSSKIKYILRIDIANFFSALNLHTLINLLSDAGFPPELASRLEAILTSFTGSRSSRGILQGMYPSDLLGNYYLEPIDRFLDDNSVASARYVDDIYIFVSNSDAADLLLRKMIPELRSYDLSLHEGKSAVIPKSALLTEEPDLQELFDAAVQEIAQQIEEEDFDVDYGFQSEWEESDDEEDGGSSESEEDDGSGLELEATKKLFDYVSQYPGHEENIERFCLPLFAKASSTHAVGHVMDSFAKRPSMSQIYSAYLANFIDQEEVAGFLVDMLDHEMLSDWSKMWILAALSQAVESDDSAVKVAIRLFKDPARHDALRAAAAIYVGRYGDLTRRRSLANMYASVSPYVQAAIYFSSRAWPKVERSNAKATWGSHTALNALLTTAMASK